MDISATVDEVQNAARHSAAAAQAALEAVSKAGKQPSDLASMAYATANEGAGIWWKLLTQGEKIKSDLLTARGQVAAMTKVQEKAAADYANAVLRVRDFAPTIPSVGSSAKLRGLTRT